MRVNKEDCFVLRTLPYSESSLIVDMFTRHHGRINLLAKGARRAKSKFRGLIRPFQRLVASWSGKGNVPTLTELSCEARNNAIASSDLYCRYYLNELLVRLIHDRDPHENLFDAYYLAIERLKEPANEFHTLRVFEKILLRELGYALVLTTEADQKTLVDAGKIYDYSFDKGPILTEKPDSLSVSGETLLAIDREEFKSDRVKNESKRFLGRAVEHYLEGKHIHSREIYSQVTRSV